MSELIDISQCIIDDFNEIISLSKKYGFKGIGFANWIDSQGHIDLRFIGQYFT